MSKKTFVEIVKGIVKSDVVRVAVCGAVGTVIVYKLYKWEERRIMNNMIAEGFMDGSDEVETTDTE